MGKKTPLTWLEFEIEATPSETAALENACETYRRGWQWGFDQKTLGLAATDWHAFRALQPSGYDEALYRGTRHGFQAAWCVLNGRGPRRECPHIAQSSAGYVRHADGEVLAFNATFAAKPPIPAGFKVLSLRIERTGSGWRGKVSGRERLIFVKQAKRAARALSRPA